MGGISSSSLSDFATLDLPRSRVRRLLSGRFHHDVKSASGEVTSSTHLQDAARNISKEILLKAVYVEVSYGRR